MSETWRMTEREEGLWDACRAQRRRDAIDDQLRWGAKGPREDWNEPLAAAAGANVCR